MPHADMMIDADGHILEPARLWREYVDPRFRAQAIQVVEREDGTETLRVPSDRPPSVSKLGPVSAGWCGRDLRKCFTRYLIPQRGLPWKRRSSLPTPT